MGQRIPRPTSLVEVSEWLSADISKRNVSVKGRPLLLSKRTFFGTAANVGFGPTHKVAARQPAEAGA